MEDKVKLSSKIILEKKFTKDVKGYNPDEVDAFLDEIIADYKNFALYQKEASTYIESLENKIKESATEVSATQGDYKSLWEKNKQLEIDNASYREKLKDIKPSDRPTAENIEYIQKINRYENFLSSHGFSQAEIDKINQR
jgi:DivIVA domain-containing protein